MTIKLRLIGIISVLGVGVVGLAGNGLLDARSAWQRSEQARSLARIDAALTRGLTAQRFERGGSTSALTVEPAKLATAIKEIGERRRALDDAFTSAIEGLSADAIAQLGFDGRDIAGHYARWRSVREEVDAAVSKPVAERNPSLASRINERAKDLVRAVNGVVATADAQIRKADPRLSNIVRVRELGWAVRNSAGDASALTNDVLGRGGAITSQEKLDYAAASREASFAFGMVRSLTEGMDGAAPLKDAVRAAQTSFFDGLLAERNRTLMPALSDPSQPRPSAFESRNKFNPGLDLLATVVMSSVDQLEAMAATAARDAQRALLVQGLILALAAIIALGGVIWVIRGVVNPLVVMAGAMRRLAGGDVSFPIPYAARRDEIGGMAGAVAVFKDNLIRTRQLEEETALARASSEKQRKAGMRQMADAFEGAGGGVIGMVSSSATELQATASAMSGTAAQTATRSISVAAAAEEAAVNVNTVAAAAEELGASVQEIGRQVSGSADLARIAVAEADRTGELVQALSGAVSRIGDVVGMISGIAGQTNLLALNATIEAARAGPAGKGFAVVAAEVKALAEQTAKATNEIGTQIAAIQASTGDAVTAIGAISGRIREISGVATSIAAAVEEQGAATQEIVRNVGQAAAGTGEVTTNIAGVAGAAEETGAAATQVLGAASELSRQSEHLAAEVSRFLETVRAA